MRKWMLVAGLAAAVVVVVLLVQGGGKTAAPAHPVVDGATPPKDATHAAPEVVQPPQDEAHKGQAASKTGVKFDHAPPEENTQGVLSYPITMERLEAYVQAVKEIRAAGEKDRVLMVKLREAGPTGELPAEMGARLEKIGELKAILDRHGLRGIDLVFMPQAVMQGRAAYAEEREGRTVPPDQVNVSSLALHRAYSRRMDAIAKEFMEELRVLSGR